MLSARMQTQELWSISVQKQLRGNKTLPPGAPKPGSAGASANAPYPHLTAGSTLP